MSTAQSLETLVPDVVFEGGDLDCGSGLVLLIRQHMLQVPAGGILEMRSREPSVAGDLPPWCRIVGHTYLGAIPGPHFVRYFVRRTTSGAEEAKALGEDLQRARSYEWRLRTRSTGPMKSTVYCRNFSWEVGQPASFEEKDAHPSAVEYLLGALSASLSTGFASEASRAGLQVDDVEIATHGQLENGLALLGLGEGEPVFSSIEIKAFVSSFEDETALHAAWERTVQRSPLAATLRKAVSLTIKLAIV
jgi:hypothetical protein